ncbi:hypothetical protein L916_11620, partial [Phytophthora nicotianae]
RSVSAAFHRERYGLDGVVGMVDGMHVIVDQKPAIDGAIHFNMKCRYSFNVQIFCDEDKRIIMAYTGWPGLCADSTVFGKTPVFTRPYDFFSPREFLRGDTGYALSNYLITPYKRPASDHPDNKVFNEVVSSARVLNENCVGLWKNRWMSLKGIRTQLKTVSEFKFVNNHIPACVLLHNIGLDRSDEWDDASIPDAEEERRLSALLFNAEPSSKSEGVKRRESLRELLFTGSSKSPIRPKHLSQLHRLIEIREVSSDLSRENAFENGIDFIVRLTHVEELDDHVVSLLQTLFT